MTPFGQEMQRLRTFRGITQKKMAADLAVSQAYLSALEAGHRGRPSRRFIHSVCQYFAIIWDEAEALEELANLSDTNVKLRSGGLTPAHCEAAVRFARVIRDLSEEEAAGLADQFRAREQTLPEQASVPDRRRRR